MSYKSPNCFFFKKLNITTTDLSKNVLLASYQLLKYIIISNISYQIGNSWVRLCMHLFTQNVITRHSVSNHRDSRRCCRGTVVTNIIRPNFASTRIRKHPRNVHAPCFRRRLHIIWWGAHKVVLWPGGGLRAHDTFPVRIPAKTSPENLKLPIASRKSRSARWTAGLSVTSKYRPYILTSPSPRYIMNILSSAPSILRKPVTRLRQFAANNGVHARHPTTDACGCDGSPKLPNRTPTNPGEQDSRTKRPNGNDTRPKPVIAGHRAQCRSDAGRRAAALF